MSSKSDERIKFIKQCLGKTYLNVSKLNKKAYELEGMSSAKVRMFLNHLHEGQNNRYLEIGVWKGSTFYSALYGNEFEYAVCIDNWSQFGSPKGEFLQNLDELKDKFDYYDEDCFTFDLSKFKHNFNVYFFDGPHFEKDQEAALTHYIDCLDDEFIYLCDDWNEEEVKKGTRNAIEKLNLEVLQEWELPSNYNGDRVNWWNGFYVAYCRKAS